MAQLNDTMVQGDLRVTGEIYGTYQHTHGNITNDGKVGTTADLPIKTGTGGAVAAGSWSSSAAAVSTTASAGSASTFSRGDHVHSISIASGTNSGQVKVAGTDVSVTGWDYKANRTLVNFSVGSPNWNDLVDTGLYEIVNSPGRGTRNSPEDGRMSLWVNRNVIPGGTVLVTQFVVGTYIYTRDKNGDTWGDWQYVVKSNTVKSIVQGELLADTDVMYVL